MDALILIYALGLVITLAIAYFNAILEIDQFGTLLGRPVKSGTLSATASWAACLFAVAWPWTVPVWLLYKLAVFMKRKSLQ